MLGPNLFEGFGIDGRVLTARVIEGITVGVRGEQKRFFKELRICQLCIGVYFYHASSVSFVVDVPTVNYLNRGSKYLLPPQSEFFCLNVVDPLPYR